MLNDGWLSGESEPGFVCNLLIGTRKSFTTALWMTSFHVLSLTSSSFWGRMWPINSIYIESVKVGPIWTDAEGEIEYCVSPAVRKVLACRSRDGDTVDGRLVDRLAPEAVMARLMSGTASSIRSNSFLMA